MNSMASISSQHVRQVQSLFVANSNVLRGFIQGLLPDPHDAEDVFQEVFLTVTDKAEMFRLDTQFVPWACAIAKFKVLERIRKRGLEKATLSPETIDALTASVPQEPPDEPTLRVLGNCMDRLAPMARRILDLRYSDCQQPRQIAQLLGQQPESIYVTLARARSFLRRCMQKVLATEGER